MCRRISYFLCNFILYSYWFRMSRFLSCVFLHQMTSNINKQKTIGEIGLSYRHPTRTTYYCQCRFTLYFCNAWSRLHFHCNSYHGFALDFAYCERWRFQVQRIWCYNAYIYLFLLQYYNNLIIWQTCIILQTVIFKIWVFMLTIVK